MSSSDSTQNSENNLSSKQHQDIGPEVGKAYIKDLLTSRIQQKVNDRLLAMDSSQARQVWVKIHPSSRLKKLTLPKLSDLEQGFADLNLSPTPSLTSLLKNINYAASSSEALNNDWQKIGTDLWRSWAAIKDEYK